MTLDQFPFPLVNASLNGTSAVLLLAGYIVIKFNAVRAHTVLMIAAVFTSTAFLACYVTYHIHHAMTHAVFTHFPEGTYWRPTYLAILQSHTLLAVVTVPLVIVTLLRAYRKQWTPHRKIAVWTFPIWFYVSVTGVIIYWMLYHLAPTLRH